MKEVEKLGLVDNLLKEGVGLQRYTWINRLGQEIWSEPRGTNIGYHWPQISIHRADCIRYC